MATQCYPFDPVEALMLYIDDKKIYHRGLDFITAQITADGKIGLGARISQHTMTSHLPFRKWIKRTRDAVRIYRSSTMQEELDLEWQWGDAVAYAHSQDFNFDAFDYESTLYPMLKEQSNLFEIIAYSANKPTLVADFG